MKVKMAYDLSSWMMFLSLLKKTYFLQTNSHIRSMSIHTTKYDIEISSYLDPKLWKLVPNEYKTIASLADSRVKIKTWVLDTCSCELCKTYIHHIGFI